MNRLRELQRAEKLTQQELADIAEVSKRTIQNWEDGTSNIKPEKAEKLANFFGVSIAHLLGYEDNDFEKANQNRLKELRKEKKDTQAELANLMGVNVKTISRWEKGEFEIKPAQAKMLADYFGVSETYLLGYSDLKNEADTKVAVLDEALKKLHAIMVLAESSESPNLVEFGIGTAIAAIENFKKEIEFGGEQ